MMCRIHSDVDGSCSTKVSALDTEKTDSPLVMFSALVEVRYCSLIPKTFASPWPMFDEVEVAIACAGTRAPAAI